MNGIAKSIAPLEFPVHFINDRSNEWNVVQAERIGGIP
jgi:hypothetical protein